MKTNKHILTTIGAKNFAKEQREKDDFYATHPKALELLLENEKFNKNIWECACGMGHLSEVLKKNGYNVFSTDLINRGYGDYTDIDFLKTDFEDLDIDIITNPPFKLALEFVKHSLKTIKTGNKIAMFLRLQFLEGKERKKFFLQNPPKIIYVSSSRLICSKNGDFKKNNNNAIAFCWFIWEKGYKKEPIIKWFN